MHLQVEVSRVTVVVMDDALKTLFIPFESGELAVPDNALFLYARYHPQLRSWPKVAGWQPLKPYAEGWTSGGFDLVTTLEGQFPAVLVLPSKSKDETLSLFAEAYDRAEDGGVIVVSMDNSSGAKRYAKRMREVAGEIGSISKNKCRVFWAVKSADWDQDLLGEWRALAEPKEAEGSEGMMTCPGVFSAGKVDEGSAMLVEHFPAEFSGMVADFGAGWGYLSREVLRRNEGIRRLDIFEADARALALAESNIVSKSKAPRFHWHDIEKGVEGPYDFIVMNPPFHLGNNTDIGLGKVFLEVAAGALAPGGKLLMVANRQLPYESELTSNGLTWVMMDQDNRFKILVATKPLAE